MDVETEDRLKGILQRIISRYNSVEDRLAGLDEDVRLIRKDMREAAILLRDKQTWRLDEVDAEIRAFARRMGEDGAAR
jgi:hypothetical protein